MSIFMILLIIGIAVPAISIIFAGIAGSIGSLFGLEIDVDADIPGSGVFQVLFPISPIIWCVQLIVMGGVGEILLLTGNFSIVPIWVIAIISGYIGMLLVNNFIMLPLKRIKSYPDTLECFVGAKAEVIEVIATGGTGAVRIDGASGTTIYAARCIDSMQISQGETVRIIKIEDNVATVEAIKVVDVEEKVINIEEDVK